MKNSVARICLPFPQFIDWKNIVNWIFAAFIQKKHSVQWFIAFTQNILGNFQGKFPDGTVPLLSVLGELFGEDVINTALGAVHGVVKRFLTKGREKRSEVTGNAIYTSGNGTGGMTV